MVYQDKDKEVTGPIIKKYGIRGYPTFVLLDSEGNELSRPSVPRSVDACKEWFAGTADGYKNVETYKAAYEKTPEDADVAMKLAAAYGYTDKAKEAVEILSKLLEKNAENVEISMKIAEAFQKMRKGAKAVAIYETLSKSVKEDDAKFVDVQLNYAKALMSTINRSNQNEVLEKIVVVNDKVLPALIKAKDERAVDPGILNARITADIIKDADAANEQMAKLTKAFGEGDRASELKFWSAMVKYSGGDAEGGKADMEAFVNGGDEDDKWVKQAANSLKGMK